jgi:hypothetical protein
MLDFYYIIIIIIIIIIIYTGNCFSTRWHWYYVQ